MKKLTYLFAVMMTIALSFASCGSDDDNGTGGNCTGSTVVERCENGAVISNKYYVFPCCQWGLSMSDVKSKMGGYTLYEEQTTPDYNNQTHLYYDLNGNYYENMSYTFVNDRLVGASYGNFTQGQSFSGNLTDIANSLVSDGCIFNNFQTIEYETYKTEYYDFYSPSEKTGLQLAGINTGYIIYFFLLD